LYGNVALGMMAVKLTGETGGSAHEHRKWLAEAHRCIVKWRPGGSGVGMELRIPAVAMVALRGLRP